MDASGIHQGHLVVTHTVALMGMPLISALYSSCLLLRTGGYFLRLVLSVRMIVREQACLLSEPAPNEELELCADFLKYTQVDPGKGATMEGDQNQMVLSVFNGGIRKWISTRKLCHYCAGESCCPGGLETTLARMTEAIVSVLLRTHRNLIH